MSLTRRGFLGATAAAAPVALAGCAGFRTSGAATDEGADGALTFTT